MSASDLEQSRTALYRHFGADGDLLYVGISICALTRLSQHRAASYWFQQITRIDIEWFDNRRDALRAERLAIRKERPKFNVVHAKTPKSDLAEKSSQDLVRRVVEFKPLYSMADAAATLGIGPQKLKELMANGSLDYIEEGRRKYLTGWHLIDYLENWQHTKGVTNKQHVEPNWDAIPGVRK